MSIAFSRANVAFYPPAAGGGRARRLVPRGGAGVEGNHAIDGGLGE